MLTPDENIKLAGLLLVVPDKGIGVYEGDDKDENIEKKVCQLNTEANKLYFTFTEIVFFSSACFYEEELGFSNQTLHITHFSDK